MGGRAGNGHHTHLRHSDAARVAGTARTVQDNDRPAEPHGADARPGRHAEAGVRWPRDDGDSHHQRQDGDTDGTHQLHAGRSGCDTAGITGRIDADADAGAPNQAWRRRPAAVKRCMAALLALVACSAKSRSDVVAPLQFEDAQGHPTPISPLPVHRIVSTMQSATEWLVLLGESQRLVARTDFDHQPELASLPSIGGGLDPSAEAVAALKPDVILGWRNRASADLEQALIPFHIPVLSFETTDTADVFRNLMQLGALVDRRDRADSLANELRRRLVAVRRDAC